MSIEGGVFQCFVHDYETGSVKKWDKHMYEIYHPLQVNQQCKKCKEWIQDTVPHPERFVERMHSNKPEDQNLIVLKCPNCDKY
jgi:hypothetical protein